MCSDFEKKTISYNLIMSIVVAVSIVVFILMICQSGRVYQKVKNSMSFEGKSSRDKYRTDEDNPFDENVSYFCHTSGSIELKKEPFMPKVCTVRTERNAMHCFVLCLLCFIY